MGRSGLGVWYCSDKCRCTVGFCGEDRAFGKKFRYWLLGSSEGLGLWQKWSLVFKHLTPVLGYKENNEIAFLAPVVIRCMGWSLGKKGAQGIIGEKFSWAFVRAG
nr:hypothetical protein [Tanacetum cinerariifolium]